MSLKPSSSRSAPHPAWLCLGPVLLAAAVYLFCMAHPQLWNTVIWPQALAHRGFPFLDMHGHAASSHAFITGQLVDGEVVPGDPFGRVHAGPKWMLWMGYLGLCPANFIGVAMLCIAVFLATTARLLSPQNGAQATYLAISLLSPPVVLLVERGNIDLFVFTVLAGAFALLAAAKPLPRWLGWGVIASFIGFKYFPALGFASLLESRGRAREKVAGLVAGALAVGTFICWQWREIIYVSGSQAENHTIPFFGLQELPIIVGYPQHSARWLGLSCWLISTLWLARLLGSLKPCETDYHHKKISFTGGGAILTFCFLATSSPDYRLVFLLFCIPWLWWLASKSNPETGLRRIARLCLSLFIAVPWWGTLIGRLAVKTDSMWLWWCGLLGKQLGWWLLMIGLGALLVRLCWAGALSLRSALPTSRPQSLHS